MEEVGVLDHATKDLPVKFESGEIDTEYSMNQALTNLTVSANESIKDMLKTSMPRVLVWSQSKLHRLNSK